MKLVTPSAPQAFERQMIEFRWLAHKQHDSKETMPAKPNSSALIREAIDAGITSPKEITAYVQKNHGVEVKASLVSFVKSTYAKNAAPAKRGRPKQEEAAEPASAPAVSSPSIAIDDLIAVKGLVDRFGKENLAKLVEVL